MGKIAKELTKEKLREYGIISVDWDEVNKEWVVIRKWYPIGCSGLARTEANKVITKLDEKEAICRHKYGMDKIYKIYQFSFHNKPISIPVARLVLAWKLGVIPEGYDACHKNNDEFDNSPDNIFIDTHANNIKQRNIYYKLSVFNQYHNTETD